MKMFQQTVSVLLLELSEWTLCTAVNIFVINCIILSNLALLHIRNKQACAILCCIFEN